MIHTLAGTRTIDVEYLGRKQYIACCLLEGDRPVIVDPGPSVSLGKLERGLSRAGLTLDDLDGVLLTHIHLDHAGAAGTIVGRNPRIDVYVHERGAHHMVDPERLLSSAERLYGDRMDELWGDFLAVPADNVRALSGGEILDVAGRRIEVSYTPGHASHHVSYLDTSTGTAFVGDTAGIRVDGNPFVLPVTPPPDIDLETWETSLRKIEAWNPERLFVTHFGVAERVEEHLQQFRSSLHDWATTVRDDVASDRTDEECVKIFTASVIAEIEERLPQETIPSYQQGNAPGMSWHGLARYWKKRSEAAP
jgi:glyoxylase-like metal-dependent hydrolase (beta-lactamase superfamily II)